MTAHTSITGAVFGGGANHTHVASLGKVQHEQSQNTSVRTCTCFLSSAFTPGSAILALFLPSVTQQSVCCCCCCCCSVCHRYETFDLRIIHRRRRTGFEDSKEFPLRKNDLIAGRYQVGG